MFTSNCCFASNSVAACTCVSGPYRPKWCCWAPAVRCCPARPQQKWEECQKRGTPMASLGTSAPSTQTRFFYLKAICPEIHASRKFSSEDSEGSKLRVAIIIRLFNQGSDLEQSFKSSLPVLGLWLGLSGLGPDLGPWLGLCGLGPWSLVLDLDLDNLLASHASHCGGWRVPTYRGLGHHTFLHWHTFLLYNQSVIAKSSLSCCTYKWTTRLTKAKKRGSVPFFCCKIGHLHSWNGWLKKLMVKIQTKLGQGMRSKVFFSLSQLSTMTTTGREEYLMQSKSSFRWGALFTNNMSFCG